VAALLGLVDLAPGHEHRDRRHRDVEGEDRAPVEELGEDAADQRPDRVADSSDAEDQATRQPRLRLRQRGKRHPQDRWPHQGPANAHADPGPDQHPEAWSDRSEQRECREQDRADEEDPATAEHVGEPAAGDDRHPEHERVGVDHPLGAADVSVELAFDVGQGDVERGEVVGDHEHAEAHGDQGHQRPWRDLLLLGGGHREQPNRWGGPKR
jgi:hypothetical protein